MRRDSRRSGRRPGRGHAAAAVWAAIAGISVLAALATAVGERGRDRIATLLDQPEPVQSVKQAREDEFDHLSAQITRLRSEMRILSLENDALATKVARLEAGPANPITTASVPDVAEHQAIARERPRQVYPPLPIHGEPVEVEYDDLPVDARGEDSYGELSPEDVLSEIAELAAPEARAAPITTGSTRFALEIGSGASTDELQELWEALSRQHDDILSELAPKYGIANGDDGTRRLLLRAGPLTNIAEALKSCSAMRGRGAACSPVSDLGEALVMR